MATYPSWDARAHWVRVYRARIRLGLELCRVCGTANEWGTGRQLTLDHIFPRSRGGTSLMENATILCLDCNNRKGDGQGEYTVSLWLEEQRAPRRQRWSQFQVPESPPGPWDVMGSRQPPRTARSRRRALRKVLPEWAHPYLVYVADDEVPTWVRGVITSHYGGPEQVPPHVRRLIG